MTTWSVQEVNTQFRRKWLPIIALSAHLKKHIFKHYSSLRKPTRTKQSSLQSLQYNCHICKVSPQKTNRQPGNTEVKQLDKQLQKGWDTELKIHLFFLKPLF